MGIFERGHILYKTIIGGGAGAPSPPILTALKLDAHAKPHQRVQKGPKHNHISPDVSETFWKIVRSNPLLSGEKTKSRKVVF